MSVRKSQKGCLRGHAGKITADPRREVINIVVIGKHPASSLIQKAVVLGKKQSESKLLLTIRIRKVLGLFTLVYVSCLTQIYRSE